MIRLIGGPVAACSGINPRLRELRADGRGLATALDLAAGCVGAMDDRSEHIEALAKMAARLAGRDPDEHFTLKIGTVTAFDDLLWRYPDFLVRAETAYEALWGARLVRPEDLDLLEASIGARAAKLVPGSKANPHAVGPEEVA